MNLWVTGENGFIAKSLNKYLSTKYNFENNINNEYYSYWRNSNNEINIFDPTLKKLIYNANIDCIIHTATIIENNDLASEMIHNNIEGTFKIIQIANKLNIPIIYIQYENHPNSIFNWTQDAISSMIKRLAYNYVEIITNEIFGPGDKNSTINKLLLSSLGKLDIVTLNIELDDSHSFMYIENFINEFDSIIGNLDKFINTTIKIYDIEEKSYSYIIDYMSNIMELDIQYHIIHHHDNINNYDDNMIILKNGEIPFETGIEITKDLLNESK